MILPSPEHVSLRTKFIIFIGSIITCSYALMLYRTAVFDEEMIIRQAEQQARMLHKQILLTRQWAADHNGLFILERQGVKPNPYLDLPTVTADSGEVYVMRNPAMITRELSIYANRDGLGHFRVTSLQPVNPANKPDDFEEKSMHEFEQGLLEQIEVVPGQDGRVVRYMSPLFVSKSCLGCHAEHGYREGDIRGALSISIPIKWADNLIHSNAKALMIIGAISVVIVTIVLFLMFESLVVRRISTIVDAMDLFPARVKKDKRIPMVFKDELDILHDHFEDFCRRLENSQQELIQTKNQAHLNEKMASLGILTAGIAHEINNPLGGMLNCLKTMDENPEDEELRNRYLPLLEKGLKQIEKTMRQLLNFGRTEPLTPQWIDPKSIFSQCIDLLQYKLNNISLSLDMAIPEKLMLDAEALKQTIVNICLNSIQAMPDGGILDISCKQKCDALVISFKDNGKGIAEKDLPHIFDPFFTTKDVGEGTGLGLAVTYSLVTRMGGEITVQTEPGKGTEFTVTLPVQNLEVAA